MTMGAPLKDILWQDHHREQLHMVGEHHQRPPKVAVVLEEATTNDRSIIRSPNSGNNINNIKPLHKMPGNLSRKENYSHIENCKKSFTIGFQFCTGIIHAICQLSCQLVATTVCLRYEV